MVRLTVFCWTLLFSLGASGATPAGEGLKLAIHPYLPPTELVQRFSPLAKYLERVLKRPITIWISKDYQEHIDNIGQDEVDIAYMGPAPYVTMVNIYGRKPLLARLAINGDPHFRGVIITRKDMPLRRIEDLKGKRFAFGDPSSTMSHLVPRYLMLQAGIGVEQLKSYEFLNSHNNVALGVLMGDFDAGAVKPEIFAKYQSRGLKVLAETPAISEHLFVASNRLPEDTVQQLREALYRLNKTPSGTVVLHAIKEDASALVPVSDADYDNLRTILAALEASGVSTLNPAGP